MIESALRFAEKAHEGQFRKGTKIPYIKHPIETAEIVTSVCPDETLVAAALLHDTVEDCEAVTLGILEEEFGMEVAALVAGESEDKSGTWEQRKTSTIYRLSSCRNELKLVALGDKLSNLRDIYNDYQQMGDDVWQKFRVRDKIKIGWYYKNLGTALGSLNDIEPYREYRQLLNQVF